MEELQLGKFQVRRNKSGTSGTIGWFEAMMSLAILEVRPPGSGWPLLNIPHLLAAGSHAGLARGPAPDAGRGGPRRPEAACTPTRPRRRPRAPLRAPSSLRPHAASKLAVT